MKRILCLWFPNWPIQRLVIQDPTLRKTRVVLFRRDSRKGQLVTAASPLAMQDGVQVDMPVSEVKQLLRHAGRKRDTYRPSHRMHPRTQYHQLARQGDIGFRNTVRSTGFSRNQDDQKTLIPKGGTATAAESKVKEKSPDENKFYILEHDPVADCEALEKLIDSLHAFSPIVGIEQTAAPESCFLDVTGLDTLFGDEQSLRTKAIRFLSDVGYTVFSAIANTTGMAWAMAHYHRSAAPAVCECYSDEMIQREFRRLPLAALRLTVETNDLFRRLGIERVEQVLAIPRMHLASRFGDEVSTRIDQALGKVSEPIIARHLPVEFAASQFIEFPTRDRETIAVVLSRLLEQICGQLQSKQKGALQWQVQLGCVGAPSIEFEVNLFQPTATVSHVLQLMELQLESALKPHLRHRRVKKSTSKRELNRTVTNVLIQEITVGVTSCVLLVQRQRELFDESPRLDKQELAYLINHLAGRLGQQSIVYPLLQSGAQPEFSFRFKPLVDPKGMRSRKRKKAKTRSHVLARPLRLLEEPVEILAGRESEVGGQKNQVPDSFLYQRLRHYVSQSWGPERIETAWWHGPTLRRDYWRIETKKGLHFWIYRDLKTGCWFLQGEF